MRLTSPARLAGLLATTLLVGSAPMHADEGFWPFNAVPKAAIKQAYGFDVTDEWVRTLQRASINFGGASASFVSPDGLVLTNHHVGLSTISKLSTPERDLVKNGYYARTPAEELKAPDLELRVLQNIEDVTARVNGAVQPEMSKADAFAARRAAMVAIERECTESTGLRCDVVTLYQGGQYHLYRSKRYTDVRLVFCPEYDTAFYGGDPDNFTYPRYALDITIFRIYENNKPLKTDTYLQFSPDGSKDGELVFTSGHPGGTQRLYTVAHLEYLRDYSLPTSIAMLERRQANLKRYSALGAEQARQVKQELFGIENGLKSMRGQIGGLKNPALMAKKQASETKLRNAVAADPKTRAEFGSAWEAIAKSRQGLPELAREQMFLEGAAAPTGVDSRLFSLARTIVRLTEESAKPEKDRLPEYADARRPSLERQLFSPAPIYKAAEQAKLADSLAYMVETLGADHPTAKAILAGKSPVDRAAELIAGTTLDDIAERKALVSGGPAAVAASTDAMIVLAKSIDPQARAIRKRYEDEVTSVERDSYAKIAQAVFATQGTSAYPDGTGTLRLSYGQVKGYVENGQAIPPYTRIGGLFDRQAQHVAQPPYDAPQRWDDRKAALDLNTPMNLVTTNDIVGGNSGSPLVNAKAQIVGLVFDGNIHMLPGYFVYDGSMSRTVCVDTRAIVEALRKVYDAGPLVDEMLGKVAPVTSSGR